MTSFMLTTGTPLFLVLVMYIFTRRIVGWHLSRRCRAKEWLKALNQALCAEFPDGPREAGLTIRMDNRCQPTSNSYIDTLQNNRDTLSSSIKNVLILQGNLKTLPQFAREEERFYNDIWNTSDGISWNKVTPVAGCGSSAAVLTIRPMLPIVHSTTMSGVPRMEFIGPIISNPRPGILGSTTMSLCSTVSCGFLRDGTKRTEMMYGILLMV